MISFKFAKSLNTCMKKLCAAVPIPDPMLEVQLVKLIVEAEELAKVPMQLIVKILLQWRKNV